jgi:hypothetical protein
MEQDTNLTYDSCKNCDRLEAEICRLEMIWETERGNNNRLKKENERLKQSPSPTGDRDCEELKKALSGLYLSIVDKNFYNSHETAIKKAKQLLNL